MKKSKINQSTLDSNTNLRSKSKKLETNRTNVINPIRNKNQLGNSRYNFSKNNENNQNDLANSKSNNNNNLGNSSTKHVKNISSSSHLVIKSVDVNYSKLIDEDQKKIDELKDQLVRQRKFLEDNKKECNEIKEKNDKMKDNIYQKNKELEKIKTEKKKYETLNNNITTKINEITQTIEEQRQRQTNLLRRREMMMNYLMSMVMGLSRRNAEEYPNVDNMSYEELLALEERMGNVSKGLSKEQIDKLPREKFMKNKFTDDKCIVCQYEFKNYEKLIVLPCKHCFHPDCIEEWLKNQKVCPYCKDEVKI